MQNNDVKRLLMVINLDWFFLSHRLEIAQEAIRHGYEVHVATSITTKLDELCQYGFIIHPFSWDRRKVGFLNEFSIFKDLYTLFRAVRPDLIHLVTIRPVLYGGIAAHFSSPRGIIFAISGLGSLFVDNTILGALKRYVVKKCYKIAFMHKNFRIIFQNLDDQARLLAFTGIDSARCEIIHGSGVNLQKFKCQTSKCHFPTFLMASRLISEKGVWDYIQAAKILKRRGVQCSFLLAGDTDDGNPSTLSHMDLKEIEVDGSVKYLGHISDMPGLFANTTAVVLPSYYGEGLPKVLIEAAASGKPVITTDTPGCRDAIVPGLTGVLVQPRNPEDLANTLQKFAEDESLSIRMGIEARKLAEDKFDVNSVIKSHISIYENMLSGEST